MEGEKAREDGLAYRSEGCQGERQILPSSLNGL